MAADEPATLAALKGHRTGLIEPCISSHGGRVVNAVGDSLLAEFQSVVAAAACAIDIQRGLAERNLGLASERRMYFRIGINLGDLLVDGDQVFGDGVNVAARLESLAEPGGICLSGQAYDQVEGKLSLPCVFVGERRVKNIAKPLRVYCIQLNGEAAAEPVEPPVVRDRPSLAVLPLVCLSDDSRYEWLAGGLTEDLTTLLARIPGLFVIARTSAFGYKGRAIDLRQVGRELGVLYIVEGSVRPVGDMLRVAVRLIEAESGSQLWADRFEAPADRAVELQDQITRGIVSRLEPELVRAEIALIRRRPLENRDAWSYYRQAYGSMSLKGWNEETFGEAAAHLRRAIALDPGFAAAYAALALCLTVGSNMGLLPRDSSVREEAAALADRAIALDGDTSEVLGFAGCALAELGETARGIELLERAIDNDPSNAQAHAALGAALVLAGEPGAGAEKLRHGMRLSPRDNRLAFWGTLLAIALYRTDRIAEALEEARAACRRDGLLHGARIVQALMLAEIGEIDEARRALAEARRIRPRLTLEEIALWTGKRAMVTLARLWRGLDPVH